MSNNSDHQKKVIKQEIKTRTEEYENLQEFNKSLQRKKEEFSRKLKSLLRTYNEEKSKLNQRGFFKMTLTLENEIQEFNLSAEKNVKELEEKNRLSRMNNQKNHDILIGEYEETGNTSRYIKENLERTGNRFYPHNVSRIGGITN